MKENDRRTKYSAQKTTMGNKNKTNVNIKPFFNILEAFFQYGYVRNLKRLQQIMVFEGEAYESIEKYTYSYHVGIKCTPIKDLDAKMGVFMIENTPEG
jgi:hypothetical protein